VSDPLYRKDLLRLAADAHGAGHLDTPSVTGSAFNSSCGDRVTVDLIVADGLVQAIAHQTKACVLAQASASILGNEFAGKGRRDLDRLYAEIEAMLGQGASAPASPFASYAVFDGVSGHPARHRCVLLPLEAIRDALDRLEAAKPGGIRSQG
jgi:NifU-like protein involved in Fe-S cluster formation